MISNPDIRLPYKDNNDDDFYTANPEEEKSLEDEINENEEQMGVKD